jgi:hypothetical protein
LSPNSIRVSFRNSPGARRVTSPFVMFTAPVCPGGYTRILRKKSISGQVMGLRNRYIHLVQINRGFWRGNRLPRGAANSGIRPSADGQTGVFAAAKCELPVWIRMGYCSLSWSGLRSRRRINFDGSTGATVVVKPTTPSRLNALRPTKPWFRVLCN